MDKSNVEAISFLRRKSRCFYADMENSIVSGIADVKLAFPDGVLIHYPHYLWTMMAASREKALELAGFAASRMEKGELFCGHDDIALQEVADIVGLRILPAPCVLAAYLSDRKIDLPSGFVMRMMTEADAPLFADTYTMIRELPNRMELAVEELSRGCMYAGISDGEIVGFIGKHKEGTMGFLEVLPRFRRRGFGTLLEKGLINEMLGEGQIPTAHIFESNKASLALQRSIGLYLSEKRIYWMADKPLSI